MDLQELADQLLGSKTHVDLASVGPNAQALHAQIGHEDLTRPLIATAFWRDFIRSAAFGKTLAKAGASPLAISQAETFVIRHGDRHDLIVFDPRFSLDPVAVPIEPATYSRGPAPLWGPRFTPGTPRSKSAGDDETLSLAAFEAASAEVFQMLVIRTPEPLTDEPALLMVRTAAVRTPPCAVSAVPSIGAEELVSTAGVFAVNQAGQRGVTAALHAIGAATHVTVDGTLCPVLTRDVMTDSCFIEYAWSGENIWGDRGPLRGLIPGQYSSAQFEGLQSGRTTTFVTAWSPDLIAPVPGSQVKIFTKVATAPGDSGAALIDREDRVIGFSFWRTGFGAVAEFSAWIWAESVFDAHQLI
jgi:hypothetical protein